MFLTKRLISCNNEEQDMNFYYYSELGRPQCLTYDGNKFVCASIYRLLASETAEVNSWNTLVVSPFDDLNCFPAAIAIFNGKCVIAGNTGLIYCENIYAEQLGSEFVKSNNFKNSQFYSLGCNTSGEFIAGGENLVVKSNDGITWEEIEPDSLGKLSPSIIKFINNKWVMACKSALGYGIVAVEGQNGTWLEYRFRDTEGVMDVAYGNGKYIAICKDISSTNLIIKTSEDLEHWKTETTLPSTGTVPKFQRMGKIAFGDNKFVVFGRDGFLTTEDGINWSNLKKHPSSSRGAWECIIYANNKFVAVNPTSTFRSLAYSITEEE